MTRLFAILLGLALLAFGLVAHAGSRVFSANLNYLGKFSAPTGTSTCNGAGTGFDYPGMGLAYNAANNSLIATSRWDRRCAAEFSIPALNGTGTFLQAFSDLSNGTAGSIPNCANEIRAGGYLLHNGSLFATYWSYYCNDANGGGIYKHSQTLSSTAGLTGPTNINSGNQRMYAGYMDNVPAAWQSALGGPAVIGQCCLAQIATTSYGPSLWAFNPDSLGAATALVYYPDGNQTLRNWSDTTANPLINQSTTIGGVTFIDGTDTVMFVGTTGTGAYCYGAGDTCGDLTFPGDQGVHNYPYIHYAWLYDVDDLAAAKAGSVNAWDVIPYAHFELTGLGSVGDRYSITGVAYDATNNKLYIGRARDMAGSTGLTIHVYQITGLGGGLLPGPSNFRRIPQ